MTEKITTWTIGSDENGGVQLNLYINDQHYTLDVHEKDVQSMQSTLDVKRILAQNKINKNVKSVRVATTITGPNGTIAEAGEILTVVRDYNRIGQPQVIRNSDGRHICDVDSYTAKQHCVPIN